MTSEAEQAQADRTLEQEQHTELAVSQQLLPAVINEVFGSLAGPELHNFGGTPEHQFRMIALATGPNVKKYTDTVGKVINVQYFYCHQVRLDGKTPGEFVDALRCVLIDSDGTAYGFVSEMLAKDLARMIRFFGVRPWVPPIAVSVTMSPGKGSHTFYNLVPVN
ncbi:hypothetical protein LCGC14_0893300 [marine sediment metagenome]|uniref:Uncharacterized protein n=1 Tax=marine sediment metagenome TaxID=412755 RepID=A0A0F9PJB4_9ZZZZ